MVTFELTSGSFAATVSTDGPLHPDLLDEMSTRCIRLFIDANASLPDEADPDDGE